MKRAFSYGFMLSAIMATTFAANAQTAPTPAYSPVRSLSEVPAGEDYHLIQPPVESAASLRGKHIAILVAPGVEDVELTYPLDYLRARGAMVDVVGPAWSDGRVLAVDYTKPTLWVALTKTYSQAQGENYDLVLITGGPWNSGVLRNDKDVLSLISKQYESGKLLASICSGAQTLIDAGLTEGKDVTGAPNIRVDLENAGATYRDTPVVTSGTLITGQDPRALPPFMQALESALTGNHP